MCDIDEYMDENVHMAKIEMKKYLGKIKAEPARYFQKVPQEEIHDVLCAVYSDKHKAAYASSLVNTVGDMTVLLADICDQPTAKKQMANWVGISDKKTLEKLLPKEFPKTKSL